MGSNLDRLAQRWDRRRSGAASSEREEEAARRAATRVTTVTVREELDVACAAEQAWELITHPERLERLAPPVILRFAVPGVPARTLGSRHVTFVPTAEGTPIGVVWEVVELDPGARIASACRSTPFALTQAFEVASLTARSCRLALESRGEVLSHLAGESAEEGRRAARRSLRLLGDHLEGRDEAPRDAPRVPVPDGARDASDIVVVMARAAVEITAPPARVWEFVLDARNDRFDSRDPDAMSFAVGGTDAGIGTSTGTGTEPGFGAGTGEVGELRCALVHPGNVPVAVVLVELVAVDPGRALVTRTRTAAHRAHITMAVEASPTGTRLSKQIDVQVRAHEIGPLRKRFTMGAEQHLMRVKRELESGR